ncbi:hypothetical protein [Erythrobacter sp. SG61-1L]|uniref:hypothetical protein n=1 Tax=Erythrobacter sp. SG61-1L TaxID=1603897 RepID=UPI000AA357E2|nr:hypothetical protein [Erythrobacter sp. SG61-1L]
MLLQNCVFEGFAGRSNGVELISTGSNTAAGTTINGSYGSGAATGDLLIASLAPETGGSGWTPPSGWTERLETNQTCDLVISTSPYPPSANTFTYGASVNKNMIGCVFRNANHDAIGTAGTRTGTGSLVIPGITLSKAGTVLAHIASTGLTGTHAPPDASWELVNSVRSGGPPVSVYKKDFPAGATGSVTFTIGGTPTATTGILQGLVPN